MKTTEAESLALLHHHLKMLRLPTVAAECAASTSTRRLGGSIREYELAA